MCGLLQYSLYGTRDAAQNREEELTSTLSELKFDEREHVPVCVERLSRASTLWQLCTVCGARLVVEFLIKMTSRKYEIKKQVIG